MKSKLFKAVDDIPVESRGTDNGVSNVGGVHRIANVGLNMIAVIRIFQLVTYSPEKKNSVVPLKLEVRLGSQWPGRALYVATGGLVLQL